MKELLSLLHPEALTVNGRTIQENVIRATIRDMSIIHPLADPWSKEGGLAVLRGNLAPNTGITKPAAIDASMQQFTGASQMF